LAARTNFSPSEGADNSRLLRVTLWNEVHAAVYSFWHGRLHRVHWCHAFWVRSTDRITYWRCDSGLERNPPHRCGFVHLWNSGRPHCRSVERSFSGHADSRHVAAYSTVFLDTDWWSGWLPGGLARSWKHLSSC